MSGRGSLAVLLMVTAILATSIPAGAASQVRRAPRGSWVTVSPPFGRKERPVRRFLTAEERRVVARIDAMVRRVPVPVEPGTGTVGSARWLVEPSLESSKLFGLQRRVLDSLEAIVEAAGGMRAGWDMTFVAARTQRHIAEALSSVGCEPSLVRTSGVVLMGASVCDRHVAVTNITGYLYLTSADQVITAEMEARPEPALRDVPYRLLVRASGGLAHEFVHSWRAAPLSGQVRADEPAWFAEGLAEFWAGVAVTRALGPRYSYLAQHVLRSRDFADWPSRCTQPLSQYRVPSALSAGCEYHLGLLAVERLHAMRPDLLAAAGSLQRAESFPTFAGWFEDAYGTNLGQFERETDAYIAAIRRADSRG